MVGDEIFPLDTCLMRPFSGKLNEESQIFNYWLWRAHGVIKNAFGILAAHWHIFSKPIKASIKNAEKYTLACTGLRNYLHLTDNPSYYLAGFVDNQSGSGEIRLGGWRNLVTETNGALSIVRNVWRCPNGEDAVEMRDGIMSYVNAVREVEWQK